ncbi:hypothetical protein M0638_10890 [Roseomonas sp. NAR14]|uniref:Uncharacterized protein n=1 Tax=Roseomonas acroporae TaxID=2937791 RepID=A0A9X2BU02_9PROT|nr:hypothetical protein [Roseomonas acroporae]MCK8784887.1 hypothetical protein [Roseomonas acroporae]
MLIRDFLNFVLDDALEDARLRAVTPAERLAFAGIELADAECRDSLAAEFPGGLGDLLCDARREAAAAIGAAAPDQWFWFARELHVEWIANVCSVILAQHHLPTIVPPTKGAAMAAAKVAGVR